MHKEAVGKGQTSVESGVCARLENFRSWLAWLGNGDVKERLPVFAVITSTVTHVRSLYFSLYGRRPVAEHLSRRCRKGSDLPNRAARGEC